jgi:hypothetical protein
MFLSQSERPSFALIQHNCCIVGLLKSWNWRNLM